jgi:hypothetical protein
MSDESTPEHIASPVRLAVGADSHSSTACTNQPSRSNCVVQSDSDAKDDNHHNTATVMQTDKLIGTSDSDSLRSDGIVHVAGSGTGSQAPVSDATRVCSEDVVDELVAMTSKLQLQSGTIATDVAAPAPGPHIVNANTNANANVNANAMLEDTASHSGKYKSWRRNNNEPGDGYTPQHRHNRKRGQRRGQRRDQAAARTSNRNFNQQSCSHGRGRGRSLHGGRDLPINQRPASHSTIAAQSAERHNVTSAGTSKLPQRRRIIANKDAARRIIHRALGVVESNPELDAIRARERAARAQRRKQYQQETQSNCETNTADSSS